MLNNRLHLRPAHARGSARGSACVFRHRWALRTPAGSGRIPASLVVRRCAVAARRSTRPAVPAGHSPWFTLPVHASRSQARCDARCRVCVLVLVVASADTAARVAAPHIRGSAPLPRLPPRTVMDNRSATITRHGPRKPRQAQEKYTATTTRT